MPRTIGVIQKPGLFEDLLSRLGVNRPVQPFTLDGEVVPVVIVESGISFVAAPTPPYNVTDIFTQGPQGVPPINTILADTGPLPVGAYTLWVYLSATETVRGNFQWRDIPNTANLRQFEMIAAVDHQVTMQFRLNIENANERFRVLNAVAGGAGQTWQATIMAKI